MSADLAEYAGTPRHLWQSLFIHIATVRPEWPINKIADSTFRCRNQRTFPELSVIAIQVAHDPKFKTPGAIHLAATGVVAL